jgi:hypothetical protein
LVFPTGWSSTTHQCPHIHFHICKSNTYANIDIIKYIFGAYVARIRVHIKCFLNSNGYG